MINSAVDSDSADQTTEYTWNGDGEQTSKTALLKAGTNSQTTDWAYAVSTGTGSVINSDNLQSQVQYPDTTTGAASGSANDVTYTVDGLGEDITMTDRNGSTHDYGINTLGEETSDSVTALGSGVDGAVRRLGFTYTPLGSIDQATTYSDTSGTNVLTQDQFDYNGLGQETREFQSNSGAVVTSGPTPTPSVQYGYAGPSSGVNYSRFVSMTFPNSRQVDTQYNGTLDSAISRPDAVADDSAPTLPLVNYSYIGLSTIVQQLDGNNIGLQTLSEKLGGPRRVGNTPSASLSLLNDSLHGVASSLRLASGAFPTPRNPDEFSDRVWYLQQAGDSSAITSGTGYGGDQYTGLDRFNRVIDQNWVLNPTPASTPTPTPTPTPVSTDRFQLGYDAGSNVLYSDNLLNPSESALYHSSSTTAGDDGTAYDPLQRLTNFERGTLSASGHNGATLDTVSSPSETLGYGLDALGNQTSVTTNGGTPVTNTANSQDEITANGSSSLGYDSDGNTTTDQNGDQLSYDPWGHIATDTTPTNHETIYTTNALGNRVSEQDTAGTASGPVLIVNNGSIQRSMVDSLTVVFPSAVTLSSGAITLYNVTTSSSESMTYSNPSSDGRTWLVTFTGSDIVGGTLPNAVYNLVVHHADVSGITMSSDVTYAFHRLFGDINGDKTVNSTDTAAFNTALAGQYDPAFDYNADGTVNAFDSLKYSHDLGTTYSYTASGAFMVGPSTTAPLSSTDISSWSAGTNDMYYSGNNVIEERQAGSSGASRQEVWGLGYVNSLIEQDTATAVDSGGVLPTSHFLQYALDTSFNSTGTLVAGSGSYDSVAIQPNGQVVVAGVSGSNLVVVRYNANGSADTAFGSSGYVTIAETSPSFAKLAIDSSGNIDVAVNSGSTVEAYQLSGTNGSTNWSTTLTFATGVIPQGMALESGGDILVAGDSSSGTGIYLAAVNPSTGAIDTSFGTSGYVNAPLSGAPSANAIALDSSGKILIAGSDSGDFSVVRLSSSGSVDTTFGTSGEAKINMGGTDTAYAVGPGPGGTIVAAGVSVQGGSNYDALIRLTSAGSLDTTFNSTGKVLGSSGSGTIRAILVQTNGEILAGGDAGSGTAQKVWMFTPSGAADTAFATGGTLTANSGATVFGWAVASGATQRIVVAGSYGGDAALAAFAPASLRLYAQQDAIYNVTAMVDSNGNVVQRYVWDPYGNMSVLSATWTPQSDLFNTQVGFQGMWLDAASGLYHTPFRDYSVLLGRWMEQDGGYWDGTNLYQALDGAPASLVDPFGLSPSTQPATRPTLPSEFNGGRLVDLPNSTVPGGLGTVAVVTDASYSSPKEGVPVDYHGIFLVFSGSQCSSAWYQWATIHTYKKDPQTGKYVEQPPQKLPLKSGGWVTSGTRVLDVPLGARSGAYGSPENNNQGTPPGGGAWIYDNPKVGAMLRATGADEVIIQFEDVLICNGKPKYRVIWEDEYDTNLNSPQYHVSDRSGPISGMPSFARGPLTGPAGPDSPDGTRYPNPVAPADLGTAPPDAAAPDPNSSAVNPPSTLPTTRISR